MRWIVFDLGGVLVKVARNWGEACVGAGIVATNTPTKSVPLWEAPCFEPFQREQIDFQEYCIQLGEWLGCTAPEAKGVHDSILLGEYQGAHHLVKSLQSLGYRCACLSNTNEAHCIEMARPEKYPSVCALDFRGFSYEARLGKPDSRFYEWFMEKTGATADQIVFFDDLESNVEAGINAGWTAFCVDHAGDTISQMREFLGLS